MGPAESNRTHYSIASSANNVWGTLMPNCFAVRPLTTKTNLPACSIREVARLLAAADRVLVIKL